MRQCAVVNAAADLVQPVVVERLVQRYLRRRRRARRRVDRRLFDGYQQLPKQLVTATNTTDCYTDRSVKPHRSPTNISHGPTGISTRNILSAMRGIIKSNVVFCLLPAKRDVQLLRCARQYPTIYAQTNRYKNYFIVPGLKHLQ